MPQRTDLIKQFLESWSQGYRAMVSNRDRSFSLLGLNRAQVELLFFLSHNQDVTIKDIAANLNTTSSAATQLVTGLVTDKLAARVGDTADRRSVRIHLTKAGQDRLLACQKSKIEYVT